VHLTCACRSCRSCRSCRRNSLPTAVIKDVGKMRPERAERLRRPDGGGVGAGRRHCQCACSSCYSAAEAQPLAARMRASQQASCQKSPRLNTTCHKQACGKPAYRRCAHTWHAQGKRVAGRYCLLAYSRARPTPQLQQSIHT
jgi:hypothetical protein